MWRCEVVVQMKMVKVTRSSPIVLKIHETFGRMLYSERCRMSTDKKTTEGKEREKKGARVTHQGWTSRAEV